MKKKNLIIISIVIGILVATGLVTSYIDMARVRNSVEPKFTIKIVSEDGSKVTYLGLGYKVVRYPSVSPNEPYKNNRGVKYGNWFTKYELDETDDIKISVEEVKDKIDNYFTNNIVDKSNMSYCYIDEENNVIIVGMMDISIEKQNEFINNVFSNCCGSKYIQYIKENKMIEFKESIDTFDAKIIETKDNSITVEVLKNSKSFKKNDKVTMKIIRPTSKKNDFYIVGNNVRITFNGMVETSNPAQISATKIEPINE